MATQKLEKSRWQAFFDGMTKILLTGKRVEIEVAAIPLGDQVAVEWLPLVGIVYDRKDDVLQVIVEGHVDHMIQHPKEIHIDEGAAGLQTVLVIDGDGIRHILKFRDPLELPAPAEAAHH
jgi:hypothetical protein